MGKRFISRGAVGLSVFIGAGALALSGTAAAEHGPFFGPVEDEVTVDDAGATLTFEEGETQDYNYDAYRVRVTTEATEDVDAADYEVVLEIEDDESALCVYSDPLDEDDPVKSLDPDLCAVPEVEGEDFAVAVIENTADVPDVFCVTMVVAAVPGEEFDIDYQLTAGAEDEEGPHFTAEEIPADEPCDAPTTLIANPALLDVELSGIQLPLGTVIAHLSSDGEPVVGRTINFVGATGLPICSAVTGANGLAGCSNLLGVLAAGGSYSASFAGDENYLPSSGSGPWIKALGIRLF